MNKVFLIIQREFLNRVQKKSFLIATIIIPMIFPAIMAVLGYLAIQQKKNAQKEVIYYIDETGFFTADTTEFKFKSFSGSLEDGKQALEKGESYGLLFIPKFDLGDPKGIALYTKAKATPSVIGDLERIVENQIRNKKIEQFNIDRKVLDNLKTDISIKAFSSESGKEEESDTMVLLGVGVAAGILMYIFIFVYGAQIMQGIIEEKMSKVVEVIVSSVKPFQLMLGKILGLASVGLLQFLIWIVLIGTLSSLVMGYFGLNVPQEQMIESMSGQNVQMQNEKVSDVFQALDRIPFTYIIFNFLFYFLGGYLLYGALFAAVGSAVDSPAEAQQFMFPITIPMLIAYFGLFTFIIDEPHGTISIWLSIIPFTSPIAMMGRIAFGVPPEQLALSMVLLVGGFVFTTWIAARIYRVGILMHGTKVNYKVLAKWFMQRG